MYETVNVFLPMRAGSERVPEKNTRKFAGIDGGLCRIKLGQLLGCKLVKAIFVSTNDPNVMEISAKFKSKKIKVIKRPSLLASSSTSTDELIKYAAQIMPDGHILWTHVTSPFIHADVYDEIIKDYFRNLEQYDSLMTVSRIQKFIWNGDVPLNYNRAQEKWPRTQTLKPLWEINSGAFIASKKIYENELDRIGKTPYLKQISVDLAFDIDWLSDFKIAESLYHTMAKS